MLTIIAAGGCFGLALCYWFALDDAPALRLFQGAGLWIVGCIVMGVTP